MPPEPPTWTLWRIARIASAVVVLIAAAYFLVVAFDNITNPTNPNGSNWPFIQNVLSGNGTPADNGFEWRFVDAQWFHVVAYIGVIAGEALAGVLMAIGGVVGLMRSATNAAWEPGQRWTLAGGVVGLLVFFFGFIVVGGNWFIMYENSQWNGLEPAFQNTVTTFLAMLMVLATAIGGRGAER